MKLVEQYFQVINESVKKFIMKRYKVAEKDFEKTDPKHSVKSIAKTKNGYVGFSHRASCEFKIGDKLFDVKFKGDMEEEELDKLKFIERGSITIKNHNQAKEAASNFAEYVS